MPEPPTRIPSSARLRHFLGAVVVVLAVLVLGGSVFVWSGYYDVAASQQHTWLTNRILALVRDQSIKARSDEVKVPDLSDPDLIALGAHHYQGGCAFCHGLPGGPPSPVVGHMLPPPPDLLGATEDYTPADLYIIVRYGLKYTGMPAWPAVDREDEMWSVVAFLVHVNRQVADAYGRIVGGPEVTEFAGSGLAVPEDHEIPALNHCVRCHGDATTAPVSDLVPGLGGQSRDYLLRALEEYRSKARPSGIMEPVARALEASEMAALADHFASLDPAPMPPADDPGGAQRGGRIAAEGLAEEGVPPCSACHEGLASREFGSLNGLSSAYIEMQLRLWQAGLRDETGYGIIMAQVARNLTPAQIEELGAYYQSKGTQPEGPG